MKQCRWTYMILSFYPGSSPLRQYYLLIFTSFPNLDPLSIFDLKTPDTIFYRRDSTCLVIPDKTIPWSFFYHLDFSFKVRRISYPFTSIFLTTIFISVIPGKKTLEGTFTPFTITCYLIFGTNNILLFL